MDIKLKDDLFNQEELENTPKRVKKFIEEEWKDGDFEFTTFKNPNYDQMIILKDIDFESLCSHHLLPFFGKVSIGYIPLKTLCGISKLARAVDKFAHKPQMQETFTQDLINFLDGNLAPKGIMIVIEAQHTCMTCRGPKKKSAIMITSAIKGIFKEEIKVKEEFLNLIK